MIVCDCVCVRVCVIIIIVIIIIVIIIIIRTISSMPGPSLDPADMIWNARLSCAIIIINQ